MAAASVGIVSPIESQATENRDFTETREEIERLLSEDPSLYERGGTEASVQSGEEYRQTLRKALENRRENILEMAWKSGSGMRKGNEQGIFFCAKVGDRTYLRFVHADNNWQPTYLDVQTENDSTRKPKIEIELGRCLRLIECSEETETVLPEISKDAAYDLWLLASENIYDSWMFETDPINLQPKMRPLNIKVADFIRENIPSNISQTQVENALDIVESPWIRRDERRLRQWFETEEIGSQKSAYLVKNILDSGLEPFVSPKPLPDISKDDIKLLVWMAISANE